MFAEAWEKMFGHMDTKLLTVVVSGEWNYPCFSLSTI